MVAGKGGKDKDANGLTRVENSGVIPESSSEKPQLERFKEAARQLETDDDEERFEQRLKKLVKQKPEGDGGQ